MDWTLADIRQAVRKYTGMLSSQQISDSDLNEAINDFYVNEFPLLIGRNELMTWHTFNTTAGTGQYSLDVDIIKIVLPIYVDNTPVWTTHDRALFFANYPWDVTTQSQPDGALIDEDGTLYLRPIPDDTYEVKFLVSQRPDSLTNDSDMPADPAWGRAIAVGTAVHVFMDQGDIEAANELQGLLMALLTQINRKELLLMANKETIRSF